MSTDVWGEMDIPKRKVVVQVQEASSSGLTSSLVPCTPGPSSKIVEENQS